MNMLFRQIVFNNMKRTGTYIVAGLLFSAVFSETAFAPDYINPATVPPSLRREGLVQSPAQVNTGNQLITGNTRGGNYFRGTVPYNSPLYFSTPLPSSSLDSFLRDSVGAEDLGRYNRYSNYQPGYRPYYSPTQTVTAVPRTSALSTNINPYSIQSYLSGNLPQRRDEALNSADAVSLGRLRPMSMTPAEMQKLISSEIAKESPGRLTEQQYQQPEPDLKRQGDETAGLKKSPTGFLDQHLLKPVDGNFPAGSQTAKPLTQEEQLGEETDESLFSAASPRSLDKQLDVYDQMKQKLDTLEKEIQLALSSQQLEKTTVSVAGEEGEKSSEEQAQRRSRIEKLVEMDLSDAEAESILGPYETFASYSNDKFNQNMRAGELYLKQGKYYRAADAYTLASIYKPNDPLAYAGRSHALFASGEYMSSALFLSRALQIFPEYALFKIDLVAMVGDRDKLETRVVDVEEWLGRSGAPELQFLLAYVYYQMNRFDKAKESIEQAYKMMPQDSAVLVLKKVIEDKVPGPADKAQMNLPDPQSLVEVEGLSK
ncbi:MAG: tetratricopeptide repeat protein [Phycisphaerae bacterium]|nr:tetratricopeptide repeat protein [Phycisphaerae bacterium]